MIKNKISATIYEVYIDRKPDMVMLPVYRGDAFNFTLIGFNKADDSPYDFSIYDELHAQIRQSTELNRNVTYEFLPDEFVLGESEEGSNIKNELHLVSGPALDFRPGLKRFWMDIRGAINDEYKTLIKLQLIVDPDVTRT